MQSTSFRKITSKRSFFSFSLKLQRECKITEFRVRELAREEFNRNWRSSEIIWFVLVRRLRTNFLFYGVWINLDCCDSYWDIFKETFYYIVFYRMDERISETRSVLPWIFRMSVILNDAYSSNLRYEGCRDVKHCSKRANNTSLICTLTCMYNVISNTIYINQCRKIPLG